MLSAFRLYNSLRNSSLTGKAFKMFRLLLIAAVLGIWQQSASAQATQPTDDAAKLYLQAAKLVDDNSALKITSPASSNLEYHEYQPYPAEWQSMERDDFPANAQARALAHQARSIDHANWPPRHSPPPNTTYLNGCRALSNELADAALFEHFQGNDAAAIETLRDDWHLADALENQPSKTFVRLLVSVGIRASVCNRLEIITSNIVLTKDPNNTKDLQTSVATQLIDEYLQQEDAAAAVNDVVQAEGTAVTAMSKPTIDRCILTYSRVNAERDLAAMSLACHLYRFDQNEWPKSLDDLRGYMPGMPVDPFGDGAQTLGYVLIKNGLPDGSDRPIVYSRGGMKDGLFYRNDRPAYSFYIGDGSHRPSRDQKQGGQFRDVANWAPAEGSHPAATTQPIE
jgi:hypothetical protein